jgi:hypothetical protein
MTQRDHRQARVDLTLTAAALSLLLASPILAATIEVDWAGSGDYERIQDGLDAAASGDTVLVHPGTYAGEGNRDLDFAGRDIVLLSIADSEATTIEPGGAPYDYHRGFNFVSGESPAAVVEGFTVADATHFDAGGIWCADSSPTIRRCQFLRCSAWGENSIEGWYGAGAFRNSYSTIEDCIFRENTSNSYCGGICIEGGAVTIRDCAFIENVGGWVGIGALWLMDGAVVTVDGSSFIGNTAMGAAIVASQSSQLWLSDSTFALNYSLNRGVVECRSAFSPEIIDCIFAFNMGQELILCENADPSIAFCCVYDNDVLHTLCGEFDNDEILREDPLFCDIESGEPWLCADSPCLPQHNPWGHHIGSGPVGCGDCDSAAEETSWGRIKAMYR